MKKIVLLLCVFTGIASYPQSVKTIYKTIDGKTVYNVESKNLFVYRSGFAVDADGSPKAYHKDSKKALDYLGNAGKPGKWWALVVDKNGNPVVQKETDPAPGYYISVTSLEDETKHYTNPTRYVNAEAIPYIAIPGGFSKDYRKGDLALVINTKNNKRCYAIFADVGPVNKIGEGSIYLARQLGLKSNPKVGSGAGPSDIAYILFKKSGQQKVLSKEKIDSIGRSKLTDEEIEELIK